MKDDNRLRMSAVYYAKNFGWAVLPLHNITPSGACSCGHACNSPGKHPRITGGLKAASKDVRQVMSWWQQWPDANIGIVTGSVSGITVLDIDEKNGGYDSIEALVKIHGAIPVTPETLTGGGGQHIVFKNNGLRNSAGKLGPGLDIRGEDGYIVAPPSNHVSGNNYEWDISRRPHETPLAEMPDWMVTLCANPPAMSAEPSLSAKVAQQKGTIPVLGRDALDFLANGAEVGVQRNRAIKAARNLLAVGTPIEEAIEKIYHGLEISPQEPNRLPWTMADAITIVKDLAEKPAPPPQETQTQAEQKFRYQRDELETMFCAAVLDDAPTAISRVAWLEPGELKSGKLSRFWTLVLDGKDASQAAGSVGIIPDLKKWANIVTVEDVEDLARQVQSTGYMEEVAKAHKALGLALASNDADMASGVLEKMQGKIPIGTTEPLDTAQALDRVVELILNPGDRMFSTGIGPLDEGMGGGFEKKALSVWAARPGMGKTTLLFQLARNVAASGRRVLFVSLEMPIENLWGKVVAGVIGVPWGDMLKGDGDLTSRAGVVVEEFMRNLPTLWVADVRLDMRQLWQMTANIKPDLVVVDHLRLLEGGRFLENIQRLGWLTSQCKFMAKQLNTHVAMIHQLNRALEHRANREPLLADLRESGQVEEDGDIIPMIHREDDDQKIGAPYSLTQIFLRKVKYGVPNQRVLLEFDTAHQVFGTLKHIKTVDLNKPVEMRQESGKTNPWQQKHWMEDR